MIEFSEEARERALEILAEQGNGETSGIRIRLIQENCSIRYEMDWEEAMQPGDRVIVKNNLIIYMDNFSYEALSNAVVEYIYDEGREGFIIRHMKSACSTCGDKATPCH